MAEHLVDPARVEVVWCMAEVLDSDLADGIGPMPEEVAAAAVLESAVMDTGMHERMVTFAGRFRRGASAFAARPGEEALIGALERQAAKADTVRATVRRSWTPCAFTRTPAARNLRRQRWRTMMDAKI